LAIDIPEIDRLTGFLIARKKPLAILDEEGNVPLALPLSRHDRVGLFRMLPGRQTALIVPNYLLTLGHRRIAFISPFHKNAWSQGRLAGCREACAGANITNGVTAFTYSDYATYWEYVGHYSPDQKVPYLSQIDHILKAVRNFPASLPAPFLQNLDVVHAKIFQIKTLEIMRPYLLSLFEKALSDHTISAWMCVNDYVALEALAFLKQKGVRVPQEISLIGFDDTIEAFKNNLTSYNFNLPAVVSRMLAYIIRPGIQGFKSRISVEVEGVIIERGSTAKPSASRRQGSPD
jgi:DNA-binding LacI/PurR family transcriptional regulator